MYILPDFVPLFPGYRDKGVELLVLFFSIPLTSQEGRGVWFQQEKSWGWKQKVCLFCLALFRKKVLARPDGASPAAFLFVWW